MDYHINIFFSEEDSGYIVDIPDLPGCSAFGDTPEKALHELVKVKTAWLETARQKKNTCSSTQVSTCYLSGSTLKYQLNLL